MQKYSDAFDVAENLSFIPHWAIGTIGCIIFMLIENAAGFAEFSWLVLTPAILFGGLVFSVISRILMLLFPWPYAWLERTINQG